MNKKEVAEIRRQYVPERCTISRICGCYVDAEKNIKTTMKEAFLSLPEDDAFKYFTIFKKTLSGTVGRNLVNLDFPLEEEHEGGHQEFLLKLRNSKLKDDALVEEFYNRIIDTFPFGENYYIILIHVAYDVPGKATGRAPRCTTLPTMYLNTCYAVSVQCICPNLDLAIMKPKTASKTGFRTGSWTSQ